MALENQTDAYPAGDIPSPEIILKLQCWVQRE